MIERRDAAQEKKTLEQVCILEESTIRVLPRGRPLGREGVQENRTERACVQRYGGVGGMAPRWSARCVQKGVNPSELLRVNPSDVIRFNLYR